MEVTGWFHVLFFFIIISGDMVVILNDDPVLGGSGVFALLSLCDNRGRFTHEAEV